jgi:predicted MPP superfamily phosphohydrolase
MQFGDAMVVFGLVFLVASAWYIPWRVSRLLGARGRLWPWRLLVAAMMFAFLLAMNRLMFASGNPAMIALYIAWAVVFCTEIYFFVFLLAAHALARPLNLKRFRAGAVIAVGLVLSLVLTLMQLQRTQRFVVTEHEVAVPGLQKPVTIFHFVDMHLGAFRGRDFLDRVVAEIRDRRPDLVIYNGDLVNSDIALRKEFFDVLGTVPAEQYFTTGNHLLDIDANKLADLLDSAGITYLRSRMVETHGLQLIGLDYMNGGESDFYGLEAEMATELTLADVLPTISRDRGAPTVLVHHAPVGFRHASMGGIDVMLTGSTHSGQKSPINSMFRLTWPEVAGRFDVGNTVVLAAQGGGNYGASFRVGISFEFQFITLVPG